MASDFASDDPRWADLLGGLVRCLLKATPHGQSGPLAGATTPGHRLR